MMFQEPIQTDPDKLWGYHIMDANAENALQAELMEPTFDLMSGQPQFYH